MSGIVVGKLSHGGKKSKQSFKIRGMAVDTSIQSLDVPRISSQGKRIGTKADSVISNLESALQPYSLNESPSLVLSARLDSRKQSHQPVLRPSAISSFAMNNGLPVPVVARLYEDMASLDRHDRQHIEKLNAYSSLPTQPKYIKQPSMNTIDLDRCSKR